ncbi:MAG: cytochrome C oxidase subunit IV family protein [Verrucomicrobiales bacterium]
MDHSHDTAKPAADLHTPDPAVVQEMRASFKKYLLVLLVLAAGTVATVAVSYVDFGGHAWNLAVGLLIATFKAACVALIFMHLNHERSTIYKFLLFTVIFFAAMMFLIVLHHFDPIHHKFDY